MTEAPMPAGESQQAPAAPTLPFAPGQPRPLTPEQLGQWQARLARAKAKAELFHPQWERALKRYAEAKVSQQKTEINALLDYRHVESKKSHLFHRTPEINLLPVDPQDLAVPYDQILPLREKVLNYEIGPNGANMKRALHKTLIDTLAASGWMVMEIGFEQVTLPVPPDPLTGQQPIDANGQPLTEVPIWSRRFITPISSKKVLVPADFNDTDFDAAPWLAYKGSMPLSQAKKAKWYLPEDYQGSAAHRDARFLHDLPPDESSDPEVPYTKIWYRASVFDPAVFNPELYRCLILVEGCDHAAWHVDSPYQGLTPEGQLTDDSMIGNPIHMDSIRDLIDSAYVPSDLVVGEQLSTETNKFRTSLMYGRKKRQPITIVNDAAGQPLIDKIAANEGPIPAPAQYFDGAGNQTLVAVVQAGSEPRDNYTAQEKCEQDWESALGVNPNSAGNFNRTKRTATEVRSVQGNSSARAETDKDRVRDYAIRGVRKADVVIQRTMTLPQVTKILGQQGAVLWGAWKNLPGKYAYNVQPDSGRYIDEKEYRQFWLQLYELIRKDPLSNGAEVLRGLIRACGLDAGKMVPADQAPEKPESPKISISVGLEQAMLVPGLMELILSMFKQEGWQIPPALEQAVQAVSGLRQQVDQLAQQSPEHGGMADKTERLNKHQSQKTGGVQGAAA